MLQRIVLLSINETEVENVIQKTKQALPPLPQVKSLQVGRIEDNSNFNLALIILFESKDDIQTFSSNPIHRDYVDNFLKPKMEAIKAYNIKIM